MKRFIPFSPSAVCICLRAQFCLGDSNMKTGRERERESEYDAGVKRGVAAECVNETSVMSERVM